MKKARSMDRVNTLTQTELYMRVSGKTIRSLASASRAGRMAKSIMVSGSIKKWKASGSVSLTTK